MLPIWHQHRGAAETTGVDNYADDQPNWVFEKHNLLIKLKDKAVFYSQIADDLYLAIPSSIQNLESCEIILFIPEQTWLFLRVILEIYA